MSRKIIITESERKSILEKYTTLGHQKTETSDFVVGNYYMECISFDDQDTTPIFSIIKILEINHDELDINREYDTLKYLEVTFTQYNELLDEEPEETSHYVDSIKGSFWQVDENEWNTVLKYPHIDNSERVDGCEVCLPIEELKVGNYYQTADFGDREVIYITKIENNRIFFKEIIFTERLRFGNENDEESFEKSIMDKIYDPSSKQYWERALSLPKLEEIKKYSNSKEENKTEEEKKQESKNTNIEIKKEEQQTNQQEQTNENLDQDITIIEKNNDKLMVGWIFEITSISTGDTEDISVKNSINDSIKKLKTYYKSKLGQNTKINYNIGKHSGENIEKKTGEGGKEHFVTTRTTTLTVTDVVDNDQITCVGDCQNGEGTLTYPNGNEYSGNFTNGKLNGRAKFIDKTRSFNAVGIFVDGIMNGNGAIKFNDGKLYRGVIKSDQNFEIISVTTPEGEVINDIIQHHNNTQYSPNTNQTEEVSFKFNGKLYFTDKLQTRNPISNGKITATKIVNNQPSETKVTTYTNQEGVFSVDLPRSFYNISVSSNNQFFKPVEIKNIKVYADITQNFNLEETREARRQRKEKKVSDDFIGIGVQTIFNNPVRIENRIHKKSDTKLEYCQRFTNYYYKVVLEKGGKLSKLNKNNLINAKNFIIGCYKGFVADYDEKLVSKIKKLSNLDGNVEVFEL